MFLGTISIVPRATHANTLDHFAPKIDGCAPAKTLIEAFQESVDINLEANRARTKRRK
jgi:hypothetical protein